MAVVTQQQQRVGSGYTTFPRTSPQRSFSHDSQQQPPSPWFSCNADNTRPDPETDHPPSPPVHNNCMLPGDGGLEQFARKSFNNQHPMRHSQRQTSCYPVQQQQREPPSYPTTIQFRPSQEDDCAPSDEEFNDPSWGLSRMSLEDTFGFDSNTKQSDDLFESLYAGNFEEDNGTKESSIELNPYSPKVGMGSKVLPKGIDAPIQSNKQKMQVNQNKNNLNRYQETNRSAQQGRDSIFRQSAAAPKAAMATSHERNINEKNKMQVDPKAVGQSYEQKINAHMQLLSPTMAMDRRRSRSKPRAPRPQPAVVSPNSSFFTTAGATSIQRTSTGTSLRRNNTGTSSQSRSRPRSTSRSHRSGSRQGSRGTSRAGSRGRRSRSRSTSIAPSSITQSTRVTTSKRSDDYHSNLFRGAALIREQLLRSMASADEAMDEAEREFMEGMTERGTRQHVSGQVKEEDGDGDDFEFDYSFEHGQPGGGVATAGNAPSPSRSSCVRFAASQDSSALETESRRLDNLVSIFGATSSMSSSNAGASNPHPGLEMKRSSSDKENEVDTRPSLDCQATAEVDEVNATHVISPISSLDLNSPTSQMMSPMQRSKVHNEYASRYFQEDAPKPIVVKPSVAAAPISTKSSNPERSSQNQHHIGAAVDEALAHAERSGPLWRSLVGNHVRFPSKWDDILPPTSPTIHSLHHKWSKWYFVARHRVKGDKRLNSREIGVRSRRSGGRILMRMVIREMHSQQICREVAIGCFHPNSKGIRKGDPSSDCEDVREVWMAVRWVMEADESEPTPDLRPEGHDYEGVVDNYLMQKRRRLDYSTMGSALGHRKAVNNENVRAVSA